MEACRTCVFPFPSSRGQNKRIMGEPEPLDLELLIDGDNDEILRAIRELGLVPLAQGVVYRVIAGQYAGDVRRVACESVRLLFTRAIFGCYSIDKIRPLLATIAERRAINFLNDPFRRRATPLEDELPGIQQRADGEEVDPLEVLGDLLANGLGLEAFALPPVVDYIVKHAGLTVVEEHLLKEHILEGCTQQEFADRHRIPLKGIGGRKDRLIQKIRTFLAAEVTGRSRTEFLQILRRNRKR